LERDVSSKGGGKAKENFGESKTTSSKAEHTFTSRDGLVAPLQEEDPSDILRGDKSLSQGSKNRPFRCLKGKKGFEISKPSASRIEGKYFPLDQRSQGKYDTREVK